MSKGVVHIGWSILGGPWTGGQCYVYTLGVLYAVCKSNASYEKLRLMRNCVNVFTVKKNEDQNADENQQS